MVRWFLVLAFVACGIVALATVPHARAENASLSALDVGQGDSILVDAGIGVMIDTGNPGEQALQKAQALGSTVGALIITHLHEDHAGDATKIIDAHPAAVFWNGRTDDTLYAKIAVEANTQHIPLVRLVKGDILHAGKATFRVLGPTPAYLTSNDPNDTSLVLRADLPGFSALLMGDTNIEGEATLPKSLVDVDVLKVGHHGSKTSTSDALLDAATPIIGLISDGKNNRYGHPTAEALARLATHHVEVYRTDQEGTITVHASAGRLVVATTSSP